MRQLMATGTADQEQGIEQGQPQNGIKSASIADTLLLVLMDDGRACLLEGDSVAKQLSENRSARNSTFCLS